MNIVLGFFPLVRIRFAVKWSLNGVISDDFMLKLSTHQLRSRGSKWPLLSPQLSIFFLACISFWIDDAIIDSSTSSSQGNIDSTESDEYLNSYLRRWIVL